MAWIGAGICEKHYPVNDAIWDDYIASMRAMGW
jgi:hypothetical protein